MTQNALVDGQGSQLNVCRSGPTTVSACSRASSVGRQSDAYEGKRLVLPPCLCRRCRTFNRCGLETVGTFYTAD